MWDADGVSIIEAAMDRPRLTVVGDGDRAGVDGEAAEYAARACRLIWESVRAGGGFFVVLDGDDPTACFWGSPVEITALAEEAARECKKMALGIGD